MIKILVDSISTEVACIDFLTVI